MSLVEICNQVQPYLQPALGVAFGILAGHCLRIAYKEKMTYCVDLVGGQRYEEKLGRIEYFTFGAFGVAGRSIIGWGTFKFTRNH